MQIFPAQRKTIGEKGTFETLARDYKAFKDVGENVSAAKAFNNVIRPIILSIDVEDVCIPALNLDLGIFP